MHKQWRTLPCFVEGEGDFDRFVVALHNHHRLRDASHASRCRLNAGSSDRTWNLGNRILGPGQNIIAGDDRRVISLATVNTVMNMPSSFYGD
jgi:hypothetical protein